MKTTVSIPDVLAAQAQASGLNVSATLREALRERLNPEEGPMVAEVGRLWGSLEIETAADRVRGELARALARKVGAARWSDSAAMASAAAALSRELCSVLDAIDGGSMRYDALSVLQEEWRERRAADAARFNGAGPPSGVGRVL